MAKLRTDDKFQGLCLQDVDGYQTIWTYDGFPPEVRDMLKNAPFNICPACLIHMTNKYGYGKLESFQKALTEMEAAIRCEEVK